MHEIRGEAAEAGILDGPGLEARLHGLRAAAVACRRAWRWHYGRFWQLRWENTLRRPSWRVDEENRAWRQMRDEVRRYAELRGQIAALSRDADGAKAKAVSR